MKTLLIALIVIAIKLSFANAQTRVNLVLYPIQIIEVHHKALENLQTASSDFVKPYSTSGFNLRVNVRKVYYRNATPFFRTVLREGQLAFQRQLKSRSVVLYSMEAK